MLPFNSDRQAKRVRQDAGLTEGAWKSRQQAIRADHRAEGARTALAQAWKERLKSKGGAAVEQLLLDQLRVRRRRCQMERCNTKTIRNSERDLGRLGWPARTGPEARLLGAGGASLPAIMIRKPFQPPSRRRWSGG